MLYLWPDRAVLVALASREHRVRVSKGSRIGIKQKSYFVTESRIRDQTDLYYTLFANMQ